MSSAAGSTSVGRRDRASRSRSRSRSRHDRSRSGSRTREERHREHRHKERAHDHHHHQHKSSKRARSRSRSPSSDEGEDRKRSKKERKHEHHTSSSSASGGGGSSVDRKALEKQLKAAQKALQSGRPSDAAAAMLDIEAVTKLLASEEAKKKSSEHGGGGGEAGEKKPSSKKKEKHAKDAKKDSKRKKHKKSKKRKDAHSSSSESDHSDSSSDSEEDDDAAAAGGPVTYLADGVTPRLTASDFFVKATEYRVWLHTTRGKHVDDIPTKRSRRYFREFVDQWNGGRLDPKYYAGIDSSTLDAKSLTKHQWSFASKMTPEEKLAVANLKDEVDSAMKHTYAQEFKGEQRIPNRVGPRPGPAAAGAMPPPSTVPDRFRDRVAQQRLQSTHAAVLEELVPKSTGREAMLEKRREKGAYARQEAGGPGAGGLEEVKDTDLMGSGGQTEYQQMLARKNAAAGRHDQEKATKLTEYQQKEKEKMQKMLASIGQQGKYPM